VGGAQGAQAREDPLLEGVALGFQVAEGGTDEQAEGTCGLCYMTSLSFDLFS
jgi:hypothetical protein